VLHIYEDNILTCVFLFWIIYIFKEDQKHVKDVCYWLILYTCSYNQKWKLLLYKCLRIYVALAFMDMLLKNSKFLITNQYVNSISFFELDPPLFSLGLKISLCLLMCAILVLSLVSTWSLSHTPNIWDCTSQLDL